MVSRVITMATETSSQQPLRAKAALGASIQAARRRAGIALRAAIGGLSGLFLLLGAGLTQVAQAEDIHREQSPSRVGSGGGKLGML